jgi:hypothetical protein
LKRRGTEAAEVFGFLSLVSYPWFLILGFLSLVPYP